MPTPRMSSTFKQADQTTFASSGTFAKDNPTTHKAAVTGAISDNAGSYYVNVDGFTVLAKTSIDAPIQVGDMVSVRRSTAGWLITGTV
jgi:hypothetical protein